MSVASMEPQGRRGPGFPGPAGPDSMTQRLYEAYRTLAYGTRVDYDDVLARSGAATLRQAQAAMRRANERLLKDEHRWLRVVPTVGYVVAHPDEHHVMSRAHERRADTHLTRAVKFVKHVDWGALSPEAKAKTLRQQQRAGLKAALARRINRQADSLPDRAATRLPTGRELVALLTKPRP